MLQPQINKRNLLPDFDTNEVAKLPYDIDFKALEQWNPHIRAFDSPANSIDILDPIGEWYDGMTAKKMAVKLQKVGNQDIIININSPGGDVFDGIAIYSLLKSHKGKVTVNIIGLAASIASIVAMAGDEIYIADAGFLMIHNAWSIQVGNRHDMAKMAADLEPIDKSLNLVYSTRTGIPKAQIAKMMDAETWITAEDSIGMGFVDGIIQSDKIKIVAEDTKSMYGVRKVDTLLAKAGLPREERRNLINEIKGTHDAASAAITHDADEINTLKTLINIFK